MIFLLACIPVVQLPLADLWGSTLRARATRMYWCSQAVLALAGDALRWQTPTDPNYVQKATSSILDAINNYGFDGVEMNYEQEQNLNDDWVAIMAQVLINIKVSGFYLVANLSLVFDYEVAFLASLGTQGAPGLGFLFAARAAASMRAGGCCAEILRAAWRCTVPG